MTLIWGMAASVLTLMIVPFFFYLLLITLAALHRRVWGGLEAAPSPDIAPTRFLIVIPAYNEAEGIHETVASCLAVDYPPDKVTVCVVADNCSDRTAAVARRAGAVVVERHDPNRRGKGHALDHLLNSTPRTVALSEYDAAVVVDADSVVDPGLLTAFAAALAKGGQWLQCYNIVSNSDDSRQTRLLTYAFSLVNGVWLFGQERLGLSVALRGNGMCFAVRSLARVPWKAHGLAEDGEFSWVLRTRGERARFVPGAAIRSVMLTQAGPDAAAQRSRWEWGRRHLRRQFFASLRGSPRLVLWLKALYTVDLLFPSMVTLLLLWGVALTAYLGVAFDDRLVPLSWVLLPAHALMAAALGLYAVSPMLVFGLPVRYLLCLLDVPAYAVWKTAVALRGEPAEWTRTRREHRWVMPGHDRDASHRTAPEFEP
jgi:cellulose synthase/poly-beta-1,6-N-acetylglucosamine synthase-like glycosyltransferase